MECKTAQQLASYLAPGKVELDAESGSALEAHLRVCPECARRIRFGEAFDQRVARAMRSVTVPAGLRAAILERIAPPREPWSRRRRVRAWAAAAAVLIAVGAALTWSGNGRPAPDLDQITGRLNEIAQDRPRAVTAWLDAHDIPFDPERRFNLNLVTSYGICPFPVGQKPTPTLRFLDPDQGGVAEVYVLRSNDFDLRNLSADLDSQGLYGFKVFVLADSDPRRQGKVVYVAVVYRADSLKPFLAPDTVTAT